LTGYIPANVNLASHDDDMADGGGTDPAPPSASPRPPGPERNMKPWAIGGALIVAGGIVAALLTGGGSPSSDSTTTKLPTRGQSTTIADAPPPRKGDKVLAAAKTRVHGIDYRVVVTIPATAGPAGGQVPVYFNEYVNGRLNRFLVPNARFFRDSVIADLKIEANPEPNPQKTAGIAMAWHAHAGDQRSQTRYWGATQQGIRLY
jgi:hypothetical protein